jgi:hypothetical protein
MLQPRPVKKTVKKSIKKPVNKSSEGPQDAFKWSKGMPNLKPTLGDGKTVARKGTTIKKAQTGDTIYSKKDRQVSKSMPFKGTVVNRNVYAVKNNNGTVEKGVELKRKHNDGTTSVRKESRTNAAPKVKKQNSNFDSEMNKNMGSMKKKVARTGASMKKCRNGCK